MDARIEKTIAALKENRFGAYYAQNSVEALEIVKGLLKDGEKLSRGGSLTIQQTGILDYMKCGKYDFKDSYTAKTPEEKEEQLRDRFFCDTFFCSANAVITDGRLYNEDGICTRVAPLLCGPKQVIVVVGKNKLVDSVHEAKKRVMTVAAPLNTQRLNCDTPCRQDGVCHNCKSDSRICCSTVITNFNRVKERIKVIIVNEDLGM
ncbi:MAG: lactate utilization protein [Oscillospiraceae bacterium]